MRMRKSLNCRMSRLLYHQPIRGPQNALMKNLNYRTMRLHQKKVYRNRHRAPALTLALIRCHRHCETSSRVPKYPRAQIGLEHWPPVPHLPTQTRHFLRRSLLCNPLNGTLRIGSRDRVRQCPAVCPHAHSSPSQSSRSSQHLKWPLLDPFRASTTVHTRQRRGGVSAAAPRRLSTRRLTRHAAARSLMVAHARPATTAATCSDPEMHSASRRRARRVTSRHAVLCAN